MKTLSIILTICIGFSLEMPQPQDLGDLGDLGDLVGDLKDLVGDLGDVGDLGGLEDLGDLGDVKTCIDATTQLFRTLSTNSYYIKQVQLLIDNVCPLLPDPEECESDVSNF